jgi:two-component system, NarL family, response regulator LiaR
MTDQIRVMIVDDHMMVRRGLRDFFQDYNDIEVVGEAENGAQAVELCAAFAPHVILMDILMPEMNGIEATAFIRQQHPKVQVVALTSLKDEDSVKGILQAGAIGYILKHASASEIVGAVRSAHGGTTVLSPEATRALIEGKSGKAPARYNLTEREIEVLAWMTKGLTNAEIAEQLFLSRSTIKFHISAILSKLGVDSRTQAVALAIEHHLI